MPAPQGPSFVSLYSASLNSGLDGVPRRCCQIVADPRHSAVEERQVLMRISKERRLPAVMYIERAEAVRIISARRAARPERREFEETTQ